MIRRLQISAIFITLLGLFLFLQYKLWMQPGGVRDMHRIKKTLLRQAAKNEKLRQSNEVLLFQIKRLQNSPDGVESRARNELGMIKKGETFYQVLADT